MSLIEMMIQLIGVNPQMSLSIYPKINPLNASCDNCFGKAENFYINRCDWMVADEIPGSGLQGK